MTLSCSGKILFEIFNHIEQISSPNRNLDLFPDLISVHFAFRNSQMKIVARIQLDNGDCNELQASFKNRH